jgi:hypothetical protein
VRRFNANVVVWMKKSLSLDEERDTTSYYIKTSRWLHQLFRTSEAVLLYIYIYSFPLKCCVIMLFKRFYFNSVMEFHPKFIVPAVIYVAGKVGNST